MKTHGTLLAFLAVLFAGLTVRAADPAVLPTVIIPPHITVSGAKVFAADLFAAGNPELKKLRERLEGTVVALSPLPGKTKLLDGRSLRDKLVELGVTSDRYAVRTPEQIEIEREAQVLLPRDIEEGVKNEFIPELPWAEVRLSEMEIPEAVVLPVGRIEMAFQRPARTDLARPFYLNVDFRVDGQLVKRGYYRTVLTIFERVPIANVELTPSASVQPEDVRWERRPLRSTLQAPIAEESFFEQRKPRTRIAAGESLTENMFVVVPLIRRGDAITLVFESGQIRVTTAGQSLAAGSKGDRIRVMNTSSRAELQAEVVDAKNARIVN
jgi:flagella basal body P-ring formation protein FlgA